MSCGKEINDSSFTSTMKRVIVQKIKIENIAVYSRCNKCRTWYDFFGRSVQKEDLSTTTDSRCISQVVHTSPQEKS